MSIFIKTTKYHSSMTKHLTKTISFSPINEKNLQSISENLKCDYDCLIVHCLTINSAILI